ncbi:MAG TPA: 4Fe-4S dicluster domain-containing protein [Opitutaceae bacterium]
MNTLQNQNVGKIGRRDMIKSLFTLTATFATSECRKDGDALNDFFREHFSEMSQESVATLLKSLEKRYSSQFNQPVSVAATPPRKDVVFGYALDIARCIGCRRCVYACVDENNQSRDPQLHWITMLQIDKDKGIDLAHADAFYDSATVPQPDKFYMPVQCQQCENPPCVKTCPVKATWKDEDGIVVIDYDWCVGCRCCVTACPYGARHFNWTTPRIPEGELNPATEYFGNRPRPKGVVEKCTFCLQRARHGRYPACVEACPVGARKFGNLLDPDSEIRYILANKRVFILKQELNTRPKFFYYFSL